MSFLAKRFTIAFQLSSVQRFSRDFMQKPENVLEHIGFCTFYATLLAKKAEAAGIKVDYAALMTAVMAHDIDESVLGDMPRSTKYLTPQIRSSVARAEEIVVGKISDWLGTNLSPAWFNAKVGLEGEILKLSDIAAVVYKNWVEVEMLNNRSFLRVCLETLGYIESIEREDYSFVFADEIEELKTMVRMILNKHAPTDADELFLHVRK